MRHVRDAVPMPRGVADQQSRKHRRDVLVLLHGLDTGWTGHDLPQKRSRRTSRTNDPAWPGTSPELPRPRQIDHSGSARTALLTTTLPHRSADPRALTSASVDDE